MKKTVLKFVAAGLIFASGFCFAETIRNSKAKKNEYMNLISSVFDFIDRNYVDEVDPKVLYEGAMRGLLSSLDDPHTTYLDAHDWSSLNDTTKGDFGGVGLTISKPVKSTPEKPAFVEVSSPIEDCPGYKAGIQAGDLIIAINGNSTEPMTMDEVLSKLRGTIGESVDVRIRRGKSMEFDRTLVRAKIEVPTVKFSKIEGTNIGYIRIIEFTPKTAERFQDALDSLNVSGYSKLIIDLRNNPGGLITSVRDVADKFIDEGTIVSTKSRISYDNTIYVANKENTKVRNIPIVVLINKGSASASEILSGALKDYKLAYLVGENSYGKGSVQNPIPLYNNDGFKITIAKYYTPSDTNIDKVGIPPDREILYPEFTEEEEKSFIKLQEDNVIAKHVELNPNMSEHDIYLYAKQLTSTYKLEERILRKLIRNEAEKIKPARVYDLDYDLQLVGAIDILNKENFHQLMKNSKTLKELQAEREAKKAAEENK